MKVNDSDISSASIWAQQIVPFSYISTFSDSKVVQDFPLNNEAGNNDVLRKNNPTLVFCIV